MNYGQWKCPLHSNSIATVEWSWIHWYKLCRRYSEPNTKNIIDDWIQLLCKVTSAPCSLSLNIILCGKAVEKKATWAAVNYTCQSNQHKILLSNTVNYYYHEAFWLGFLWAFGMCIVCWVLTEVAGNLRIQCIQTDFMQ